MGCTQANSRKIYPVSPGSSSGGRLRSGSGTKLAEEEKVLAQSYRSEQIKASERLPKIVRQDLSMQ